MNNVEYVFLLMGFSCIVVASLIIINHRRARDIKAYERRKSIHIVKNINERV